MKSAYGHHVRVPSFYLTDGPDRFLAQPSTAGPWGPDSQHGGPPAALLTRAVERLVEGRGLVLGRLTVDAVLGRDYPTIQGVILVFSFAYVLVNLLIDITYTLFDPRIRY